MSEQRNLPDGSTDWEKAIAVEANNFVSAVQQNFIFGLKTTRKMLPKADQYHLLAQLNIFVDAVVAVNVQIACNFINPAPEIEENIILAMREKFRLVREQIAQAAKEKENASGLVGTDGKPLSKDGPTLVAP